MTTAAANAALSAQRVELSMRALVVAKTQIDRVVSSLGAAATRMEAAKTPLFAAAGVVSEGQGTGHRLGNAASAAERRTRELLTQAQALAEAIEDLRLGEQRFQTDINVWENVLRN